jgi:hypothetical protein
MPVAPETQPHEVSLRLLIQRALLRELLPGDLSLPGDESVASEGLLVEEDAAAEPEGFVELLIEGQSDSVRGLSCCLLVRLAGPS